MPVDDKLYERRSLRSVEIADSHIIKSSEIPFRCSLPFFGSMDDDYRWYLLRTKHLEQLMIGSFEAFRAEGIEPVLIKGWAAARNYPDRKPRFFGDIDLAVSRADYERALALVERPGSGANGVDLHCELRHLDTLEWQKLFARSELIDLDTTQIRILAAEDHLRVLCVHWLTNGGESKERLWDIYYAVQNRPKSFDWSKCLDVVSENRRGWIIATIGLAHKYLGLDIGDLPFADEAKSLPGWLTRCVEKEWDRAIVMRPIHTALRDPKAFLQQVRKRFPPNPIQATVDCEGRFDDGTRVGYQIRDVFIRLVPSVKRVVPTMLENAGAK